MGTRRTKAGGGTEDPGLVEYDGGLKLSGTTLWLDARRPVPLSFVSSALALRRHQRILTSAATAELLGERLASMQALASPMGRPFSLGELVLELVPSGHVVGGAQLLLRYRGLRILYCGGVRPEPTAVAERHEPRRADVLVLDCPYDAAPFVFPSPGRTARAVLSWTRQVLASGGVPVLLARPLGTAQELCRLLADDGLPVLSHRTVAAWNRRARRAGRDPGKASAVRRPVTGGRAALVWPVEAAGRGLDRLAPGARRALVSGRALIEPDVRAIGAEIGFPLSSHADSRALRALVAESGARYVYLGPRHSRRFEALLRRDGLGVTRFAGPPTSSQLDLF